ncbi:1909_t:CDS:10 [Entrophospora sp. SA101]|nr:1909_t:CDS:10 [Entrophospora sp. SA101]
MSQHNNYPTQYPQQQCYQSQPASQPASQSQQTTQTTQYTQQYHDQYPQHLQQTQIEYMPISSSIYENYAIPYNNNNSQAIPSSISSNSSQQNLLASQLQPNQLLLKKQQEEQNQREQQQQLLLKKQQEEQQRQQLLKKQQEEQQRQQQHLLFLKQQQEEQQRQLLLKKQQEEQQRQQLLKKQQEEQKQREQQQLLLKKQQEEQRQREQQQQMLLKRQQEEQKLILLKQQQQEEQRQPAKKPITAESSTSHNNSNLTNGNNKPVAISSDQKRYLLAAIKCLEALLNYLESNVDNNNNDEHEKPLVELKTRFRLSQILFLFTENIHEAENHLQKGQDDFRELKFKMIDLRCDIFKSNNNSNSAKNLLKSSAIEAMENNMPPWYYHFQLKRANLHYSEKDFDGCMNVLRQVCSLADQRADVEMKACVLILIAQYAFTSQNYTLTQRSLDELQTVYFPSSLIQSSQAYNRFPISNRHLYLHFSLLYITYHMHTGNMKLAAERLSEVHHILDSNSLNDINVDGSTGETTIHISPVSESSLSLSYPNNNDKSSTTSQNLPLKICWLSNSQIYALTFLISGICNRGDTATMKSTMFLTEGLKIVEQNGLSLQEIIKSKKFYINLKAYMLQYLIDVYLLRSEFTEAEKTLAQLMNWSNIHNLWPQFHINIIIALGMINQFIGKPIIATEFYKAAEKVTYQHYCRRQSLLESLKISTSLFNNQLKALTLSVLGTLFKVTQNDQAEKMLTSSYTLSKNARNNIGCLISGRLLEEIYQKQQKLSDHANQVTSNRKHEMDVCKFLSEWSMKSRVVFNLLDDNNNNGVGGNNVDGVVANVSNPSSNIYNNIPSTTNKNNILMSLDGSHGNSSGGEHL